MAIIVKEQKDKIKEWIDYPKLMQDQNGDIFYMVKEDYGLPLTGHGWAFVCRDFADFSESDRKFTDYNGEITIQNKQ